MEDKIIEKGSQQKKSLVTIKQVRDVGDLKRRVLTLGFYGAAGFLGYRFLLKPALANMRRKHEQNTMLTDPNKQQATVLHNAMNPAGIKWMRSMDQTNEDMIYSAARQITNWNAVQTTYRNLYNRDLLSDLQSELDSDEYQIFLKILSSGKAGNKTAGSSKVNTQSGSIGMIIASSKDVRLRSTPDSSKGTFSIDTNILGTAKAGKFLGWATGKQQIDNRGVRYIEVKIHFRESIPAGVFQSVYRKLKVKTMNFWVGAGAIHQFKYYKELFSKGVKLYKGLSDMGLRKDFK